MKSSYHRNINEELLNTKTFPKVGFATLNCTLLSESQFIQSYEDLDQIAHLVDTSYDENFAKLDRDASHYALNRKYLLDATDVPIVFKNMRKDTQKYQKLTDHKIRHEMVSFHYISGLYEFLLQSSQKDYQIPKKVDSFLKMLDAQEKAITAQLEPFLQGIGRKTNYYTSIKIWKHTFEAQKKYQTLLPLHYDRSLFSAVLHTQNVPNVSRNKEEFLRIFPNREEDLLSEVLKKYRPYPLNASDFPLLFPGWAAKELLHFAPTPHCVAGKMQGLTHRNSYVWFINAIRSKSFQYTSF